MSQRPARDIGVSTMLGATQLTPIPAETKSVASALASISTPAVVVNPIHAGHAACVYSCRMPPSCSCRRMSRWMIFSGSAMGAGCGRSGAVFAIP